MHKMTRRRFGGALCAATAGAMLPRPARAAGDSRVHVIDMANAPFFDRDALPSGLDGANACTRPNHLFLEGLVNSGIDTVFRYYSDQNNAGLTCKNVTRRERDLLHDHGLALAIVYQFEGRSRNRYTAARAGQDARFCLDRARVIGQPDGSAIYFGVDSDAALNSDAGVLGYFREVNRIFDGRFRVGIYAAGARCALIRDAGLAEFFWVPEAPAWAGTRAFLNGGGWTLYQNRTDIERSRLTADMGLPLAIDTDFLNPAAPPTLGAFRADGSEMHYDPVRLSAVAAARKWVNADRLAIFDEPGGTEVAHACIARLVHVIEAGNGWALVDVDEDGFAEGYCRTDDLSDLGRMPRWRRSGCVPMNV